MAEYIDRPRVKSEAKQLLRDAQVPAKLFFLLYLLIRLGLTVIEDAATGAYNSTATSDTYFYSTIFSNPLGIFATVLTWLLTLLLLTGVYLYCMTIRRGERAEYLTLFDAFSFAGKVILLYIVETIFIFLWMLLLIFPSIIAAYRYRFAILDLCENPSLGVMEALNMSKQQTNGYKGQLFLLDLSYTGWILLATLPSIIYTSYITYSFGDPYGSVASIPTVSIANSFLLTLLFSLWAVAVEVFYVPVQTTTMIGFFEIAKRSSGIGAGAAPPESRNPDTNANL